jgi:hypothetical protein
MIVCREWLAVTDLMESNRLSSESMHGRKIQHIADLLVHDHAKQAKLTEPEILALQLYTGKLLSFS